MECKEFVILALIGCVIGLGIAIVYDLTLWWQILLCIGCAIAGVFAIVSLVLFILGLILYFCFMKWWQEHGDEFVCQLKTKVKKAVKTILKVLFN